MCFLVDSVMVTNFQCRFQQAASLPVLFTVTNYFIGAQHQAILSYLNHMYFDQMLLSFPIGLQLITILVVN